jgi:hypothetical protein
VERRQGDGEACAEAFSEDLAQQGNLLSAFFAMNNASSAIWHGSHDRFGALQMKAFHPLRSGDGRIMGVAFAVDKDIPA